MFAVKSKHLNSIYTYNKYSKKITKKTMENKIKIEEKHNKLREILINYECKEFGDCIVDEICNLFKYPNTVYSEETDKKICSKCGSKEHVHFRQSMEYVCDKCINEGLN